MESWVDQGDLLHNEMVYLPADVTHPSTNLAQCQLTTLIEANMLTTTLHRHPDLWQEIIVVVNLGHWQQVLWQQDYHDNDKDENYVLVHLSRDVIKFQSMA